MHKIAQFLLYIHIYNLMVWEPMDGQASSRHILEMMRVCWRDLGGRDPCSNGIHWNCIILQLAAGNASAWFNHQLTRQLLRVALLMVQRDFGFAHDMPFALDNQFMEILTTDKNKESRTIYFPLNLRETGPLALIRKVILGHLPLKPGGRCCHLCSHTRLGVRQCSSEWRLNFITSEMHFSPSIGNTEQMLIWQLISNEWRAGVICRSELTPN